MLRSNVVHRFFHCIVFVAAVSVHAPPQNTELVQPLADGAAMGDSSIIARDVEAGIASSSTADTRRENIDTLIKAFASGDPGSVQQSHPRHPKKWELQGLSLNVRWVKLPKDLALAYPSTDHAYHFVDSVDALCTQDWSLP